MLVFPSQHVECVNVMEASPSLSFYTLILVQPSVMLFNSTQSPAFPGQLELTRYS